MAEYTQHCGLHLWGPGDSFLRTDFNEDHTRIDAALGRAERSGQANAYNVYNLMLQNYYEGKYTGYKKALLFDGFLDDAEIAAQSEHLLRGQGKLLLTRSGQENHSFGYSDTYTSFRLNGIWTPAWTSQNNGILTGLAIKDKSTDNNKATVDYEVELDGKIAASGTVSVPFSPTATERTVTLTEAVPVPAGTVLRIHLTPKSSIIEVSTAPGETMMLGGVLLFTPLGGTAASVTGKAAALPPRNRLLAWVRHRNGSVALTALAGAQEFSLGVTGTSGGRNLQNEACSETSFLLDGAPGESPLAFRLDLALNSGQSRAELFDWGVVLL